MAFPTLLCVSEAIFMCLIIIISSTGYFFLFFKKNEGQAHLHSATLTSNFCPRTPFFFQKTYITTILQKTNDVRHMALCEQLALAYFFKRIFFTKKRILTTNCGWHFLKRKGIRKSSCYKKCC